MPYLADGRYWIAFTNEQCLSAPESTPGAPLMLLSPDGDVIQTWEVKGDGNGTHIISADGLFVGYDGEPDMHEPAVLLPEPRPWRIVPAAEPGSFFISVVDAPLRLGLSLLRVFPPRVALAPEYGPEYQAWTFRPAN